MNHVTRAISCTRSLHGLVKSRAEDKSTVEGRAERKRERAEASGKERQIGKAREKERVSGGGGGGGGAGSGEGGREEGSMSEAIGEQ